MLLYAITQRSLFIGDETAREKALLNLARGLARSGVHYLQIREKDLPLSSLQLLATSIVEAARVEGSQTRILLNGPPAIAFQAGCHGIHLASDAPANAALVARRLYGQEGRECVVSAACHSTREIHERRNFTDLLLFSPVFEKITPEGIIPGTGLSALSEAATQARGLPVLALGGVSVKNAHACVAAGAKGIAAIRLFMDQGWTSLVHA